MKLKQKKQVKLFYAVRYSGLSSRFANFLEVVKASDRSEAVRLIYAKYCDADYFVQADQSVKDSDGNIIAERGDETVYFDGGFFYVAAVLAPFDSTNPEEFLNNVNDYRN